jgi:hypothetical protein
MYIMDWYICVDPWLHNDPGQNVEVIWQQMQ